MAPSGRSRGPLPRRRFYQLYADGGIHHTVPGKPQGEAAIGVVLKDPQGDPIHDMSVRIGPVPDHHIAEYRALIAGLRLARGHGIDHLRVFLDSALVVNQVNGKARVKKAYLDDLTKAMALLREFSDASVARVGRGKNSEAHKLADAALGR